MEGPTSLSLAIFHGFILEECAAWIAGGIVPAVEEREISFPKKTIPSVSRMTALFQTILKIAPALCLVKWGCRRSRKDCRNMVLVWDMENLPKQPMPFRQPHDEIGRREAEKLQKSVGRGAEPGHLYAKDRGRVPSST